MGSVELETGKLFIHSHIITYGLAAQPAVAESMRQEIETLWNEPAAIIRMRGEYYSVVFRISAGFRPEITDLEIIQNLDPANNYFRIEEYAHLNISYVDGIGSNSGYFIIQNLNAGSTTAAHEYGHTIGL